MSENVTTTGVIKSRGTPKDHLADRGCNQAVVLGHADGDHDHHDHAQWGNGDKIGGQRIFFLR